MVSQRMEVWDRGNDAIAGNSFKLFSPISFFAILKNRFINKPGIMREKKLILFHAMMKTQKEYLYELLSKKNCLKSIS